MTLFQKIDHELIYPFQLRTVAKGVQKAESFRYKDASSKKMMELSSGMLMWRDFMCGVGSAALGLQRAILLKHFGQNKDKFQNKQSIVYSVAEIYDILSEHPLEEANEVLTYIRTSKPAVVDMLQVALSKKDKEEFVHLLYENECDLTDINKALLYIEILGAKICDHGKGVEIIDPNFIERYSGILLNHIFELTGLNQHEGTQQSTSREYLTRLLQLCKDLNERFDNLNINPSQESFKEFLAIPNEFFPQLIDIQYEYYVKWYLDMEEILMKEEKEIYLEFVRTPEYEEKYDSIERGYYNLPEDCPFINIKPKQLATIIEILKEKATHKAGNKAKNKDFCRVDVLDAIVALKLLGVFVVPKNDNNGLKDLTRWLDDNIPNSNLSKPENQYRVNDHLRKKENEYKDAVKKDIAIFKDLGIG